jgi:hypothetical protein
LRLVAPILLLLALAACRRDPPPPAAQPQPDAGGPAEAGTAAAAVLDEGREPRAPVTFAFVPGRREARVLEIDSRFEMGERSRLNEHVDLRFEVRYTAADAVELTLRHAETTAPDIPGIGTTLGAVFRQRFRKDGTADPPEAVFPPGANGTAKQYVEGAVTQVAASLLPAFPPRPLGEGARWRWGKGEGPTYQLVSRREGRVVVEEIVEIHGPRRVETGKTIQVNEDQRTRMEVPLDGIARNVEATLVIDPAKGTKRTTHLRFDVIDEP